MKNLPPFFVERGIQMYFASFVLARPRIFLPICNHLSTYTCMDPENTCPCIWSQFSHSPYENVGFFCAFLHYPVNSFVWLLLPLLCFCGHVNALPRPPTTTYAPAHHAVVVIVKHFFLSPLCMPHSVFPPVFFLFSRRTESALNFYLILSQLRCGCLTWLHSTSLFRRLKSSAGECVIFYGVNLTMIGFRQPKEKEPVLLCQFLKLNIPGGPRFC